MTTPSTQQALPYTGIIDEIWRVPGHSRVLVFVRLGVLAMIGSALLFIASQSAINLSFSPVPITMQTFAVFLIAVAYGWRLGLLTLLLFFAESAFLPVFANLKTGSMLLFGPTAGYVVGWVFAVAVCGWLVEKGWERRLPTLIAAMLLGMLALYIPGLIRLSQFIGWGAWGQTTLAAGLYPFVLGDLVKIGLVLWVLPGTRAMIRKYCGALK